MKALIVYDSDYGNTGEVAKAIARGIGRDARLAHVREIGANDAPKYDLVLVGSPTQGGRPTQAIKLFLNQIPDASLGKAAVTGFDTRIDSTAQGFVMRTFMGFLGYPAGRIARRLEEKGGHLIAEPEGFYVEGKEGPLRDGELDRAAAWGSRLARVAAAV